MSKVQLTLNKNGRSSFFIMEDVEQIGEMEFEIKEKILTVYHTEVAEKAEGKGFAKMLLKEMTDYARRNNLKVIPLCTYVHTQFQRHPKEYEDVWQKSTNDA